MKLDPTKLFSSGQFTLPDDVQKLSMTVQDTGGFQNFIERDIGQFKFQEPGRYIVAVIPRTKKANAVMDLRQIVLRATKPETKETQK